MRFKKLLSTFTFAGLALALGGVQAQQYPTKAVHIVVGFPPGGPSDLLARTVAQKLSEGFGSPFVVDNKPGGNTLIAASFVAHAQPDGYTLFESIDSTLTMNGSLYSKLPYDPVKDFAPISNLVTSGTLLVSNPKLPVRSMSELFAHAKANPGKLNYGATSPAFQLLTEQFKSTLGINVVLVPFKGTAELTPAVLSGQIDFVVDAAATYAQHIKEGKLIGLATFGKARDLLLPNVPTSIEQGYPQFEKVNWIALLATAGTPQPIVARLSAEVNKGLAQAEVKQKLAALGQLASPTTPEQLANTIRADIAKWTPIIRAAGIKLD